MPTCCSLHYCENTPSYKQEIIDPTSRVILTRYYCAIHLNDEKGNRRINLEPYKAPYTMDANNPLQKPAANAPITERIAWATNNVASVGKTTEDRRRDMKDAERNYNTASCALSNAQIELDKLIAEFKKSFPSWSN
jgi:hypothetical protein